MTNKKIVLIISVIALIILSVLLGVTLKHSDAAPAENAVINNENAAINDEIDENVLNNNALNNNQPIQQEQQKVQETGKYPIHENIWTTYFYIGEPESEDNGYISNFHSAWDERWVEHYGGVDDPKCRIDYYPCKFVPEENPFYCALPYGDYDDVGRKDNRVIVPWFNAAEDAKSSDDTSIIKNRWIRVGFSGNTCYCQWEDVGPAESDDTNYVFGTSQPIHSNSGLDVSPAMMNCLGIDGHDQTDWQFVDDEDVPDGPWKDISTVSGTCWIYPGSECE